MSEDRPNESVWIAAPNAEFEALKRLPQQQPSPERVKQLDDEARRDLATRAGAYRTPVTQETLRHCLR